MGDRGARDFGLRTSTRAIYPGSSASTSVSAMKMAELFSMS